ncbi:MAG: MoxR family ATPase [Candidatus Babeliales bacterium]|nr:MoxR family ATPase [Candidatus Babeliales bacterium]
MKNQIVKIRIIKFDYMKDKNMNDMMLEKNTKLNTPELTEEIAVSSQAFDLLKREISKVIIGNEEIINFICIAIICNGHILLEGVPGVAKTTMIKAFSNALGLVFKRIQFTPDLLPTDLIGTLIYNQKTQEFETKKGPIFANIILADEINRASAKVQSALLECMQEHQVTIGSQTYKLDEPFFVFATQNPVEQEGTYQLPEAQLDRFMFKLMVNYPSIQEEKKIVTNIGLHNVINQVLSKENIFKAQELVNSIYLDEKILDYIVSIVAATRDPEKFNIKNIKEYISYGVSPRATIALYQASKAQAFLKHRHFVIPDDVKFIAFAIIRHRLILSYEAQADNINADDIVKKILETLPSP